MSPSGKEIKARLWVRAFNSEHLWCIRSLQVFYRLANPMPSLIVHLLQWLGSELFKGRDVFSVYLNPVLTADYGVLEGKKRGILVVNIVTLFLHLPFLFCYIIFTNAYFMFRQEFSVSEHILVFMP